jgi:hypothetical protein
MDVFVALRNRYSLDHTQPLVWLVVTIVLSSLLYGKRSQKYPRVGNSKLLTWIPTIAPMRYSLEQYANQGYEKVIPLREQFIRLLEHAKPLRSLTKLFRNHLS